jgi:hypothetical protein
MAGFGWRLLAAVLLVLVVAASRGQELPAGRGRPAIPSPVSTANVRPNEPLGAVPSSVQHSLLSPLVRSAGIIFSGRVISVGRIGTSSMQEAASTVITFQVEHAIRGTVSGQNLTIREWAALWNRGEKYRVGERVLLFLYPESKLGFTSPVSGSLGRFAVDRQDRILLNLRNIAIFADDPLIGGKTAVPYTEFAAAVQRSIDQK